MNGRALRSPSLQRAAGSRFHSCILSYPLFLALHIRPLTISFPVRTEGLFLKITLTCLFWGAVRMDSRGQCVGVTSLPSLCRPWGRNSMSLGIAASGFSGFPTEPLRALGWTLDKELVLSKKCLFILSGPSGNSWLTFPSQCTNPSPVLSASPCD